MSIQEKEREQASTQERNRRSSAMHPLLLLSLCGWLLSSLVLALVCSCFCFLALPCLVVSRCLHAHRTLPARPQCTACVAYCRCSCLFWYSPLAPTHSVRSSWYKHTCPPITSGPKRRRPPGGPRRQLSYARTQADIRPTAPCEHTYNKTQPSRSTHPRTRGRPAAAATARPGLGLDALGLLLLLGQCRRLPSTYTAHEIDESVTSK